jgi:hypothetical protein
MLRIAGTFGGSARAATPEQAAFIGNQAGGRFGARHQPVMSARLTPVPAHPP